MSTWAERIRALQDKGLTLSRIGEEVGLATSSVSDLANGRSASPRGEAALKLHALHERVCGSAESCRSSAA